MKAAQPIPDFVMTRLNELLDDPQMITVDAYTPNSVDYPTNRISFVEIHMRYLRSHKNVDPVQYISNLELMIKKR